MMREVFDYRGSLFFRRWYCYFAFYGLITVCAMLAMIMGEWIAAILALLGFLPALWIGMQRRKVFLFERIVVEDDVIEYTGPDGVATIHKRSDTRYLREHMSLLFSCRVVEFESSSGTFRVLGFVDDISRLKELI